MSHVFGDAIQDPIRGGPVVAMWTVLTLHLFKPYLPKSTHKFDPITIMANAAYNVGVSHVFEGESDAIAGNGG
jgi:hypothetical protein